MPHPRTLLVLALAAGLAVPGSSAAATAPARFTREQLARHLTAVKRLEIELQRLGARRAFDRARAARRGAPAGGAHARPAPADVLPGAARAAARPARVISAQAVPANVKLNDSSADAATATQSEQSVAALGDQLVAAWNDGQATFVGGPYQGYGWSTDGGQTWTDGGGPPSPAGFPQFRWMSDPVVTVNERTGIFYYVGLANSDPSHSAIAVARGAFNGGAFSWLDVQVVREESNASAVLDKPWIAADSSGPGTSVYMTCTVYTHAGNQIDLQRSTDGGTTWSNSSKLSSAGDNGRVQGSRPVVGPGGELYVVWTAIGDEAEDFLRIRKSVNRGQSFATEATVTGYVANFGTGAPGYNRERGIHFPSAIVDRTAGPFRGRVYVGWTESYNFQDDPLATTGVSRVEVEPNGFFASAPGFTVGDVLRGQTSSSTDFDWWTFTLGAGESVVVWADSLPAGQTYGLRVFAGGADSAQSLCFGGDFTPGSQVQQAYYTFTAPVAATYGLRIGPIGAGVTGGYRIRTGVGVRASERGRDQRDVFVSWSDAGTVWSAPARVNDDPVGYDDWLAEVGVGSDGCPYALWFDFRDHPFGALAHQYVSRSSDGGSGWAANRRVTSVPTNWVVTGTSLAPNMGDYAALASSGHWLHAAWADGRDGSADVYGARIGMGPAIAGCAADAAVTPGSSLELSWTVANTNTVFPNPFPYSVTAGRNWPMPSPSSVMVAEAGSAEVQFVIPVPDTAAAGPVTLQFAAAGAASAPSATCATTLTVTSSTAVGGGATTLTLEPPVPNPASVRATIGFALARRGMATLRIYGPGGQRVRTLVDGEREAGAHHATWDGRDDRGAPVPVGVYFARLETSAGARTRRIVWLR